MIRDQGGVKPTFKLRLLSSTSKYFLGSLALSGLPISIEDGSAKGIAIARGRGVSSDSFVEIMGGVLSSCSLSDPRAVAPTLGGQIGSSSCGLKGLVCVVPLGTSEKNGAALAELEDSDDKGSDALRSFHRLKAIMSAFASFRGPILEDR